MSTVGGGGGLIARCGCHGDDTSSWCCVVMAHVVMVMCCDGVQFCHAEFGIKPKLAETALLFYIG